MSCSRPLKLFWTDAYSKPHYDVDYDTGELRDIKQGFTRYRTKVCSPNVHHVELHDTGLWPVESESVGIGCKRVFDKWIYVPCGKCPGCILDRSRVWADRLMCELLYHDPNECWFVTLTYNEKVVPTNYYIDDNSEEHKVYSLRSDDVTKFIKDLREYFRYHGQRTGIRFYLSGEYGERTKRPHYHAILFSCPLDNDKLVVWSRTSQNFTLYRCPELEKIWSKGNVLVSSVSWSTCAYVAKYVTKKLGKTSYIYEKLGIEPEFSRMSRRPGIGYQYLVDHPECIEKGIHLTLPDRGVNFSAPRYFKSFTNASELDIIHTDVQERQQDADDSVLNSTTFESISEYLEKQEEALVAALANSKERSAI